MGSASTRILVVGCGGIGGTVVGGLLAHAPEVLGEVLAVSRNAQIARAVAARGYVLTGVGEPVIRRGRVIESPADTSGPFDYIILAVQPPQVEEAARTWAPLLGPAGRMVCFQNGLCEWRVAEIVGPERVIGGVVAWGASMPEPGVFERTSSGGFVLGRLDGQEDPQLLLLSLLLESVGPVSVTDNLAGARWSKLAINCAISTLGTIGGDRLGVLMKMRVTRRLALEVMSEVVMVAQAEGVRLEKVAGTLDLEWLALTDEERAVRGSAALVAKHTLLLAVGTRYRRLRSSMLAAIERGRAPAVDFLNGEVVTRAERHGLSAPVNARAQALVHAIARGEETSSPERLRSLAGTVGIDISW